jgi:hypothetical protein
MPTSQSGCAFSVAEGGSGEKRKGDGVELSTDSKRNKVRYSYLGKYLSEKCFLGLRFF